MGKGLAVYWGMKSKRTVGPLISLGVHALILFCVFYFFSFATRQSDPEITVIMGPPDEDGQIIVSPPPEPSPESPRPDVAPSEDLFKSAQTDESILEVLPVGPVVSLKDPEVKRIPKVELNRRICRTPQVLIEQRKRFAPEHGEEVEVAIMKALRWLKATQREDGSWEGERPVGVTGMALLTFLAHGETPVSLEFGATVERAMQYLLAQQDERGLFTRTGHQYGHAVATYALAEAYGMTRIPTIRPAIERGVSVIIDGMQLGKVMPEGSMVKVSGVDTDNVEGVTIGCWDYNYKQSGRMDTSFGGWQIQALKAAALAEISHDRMLQTIALARNGLKYAYNEDTGKFRYNVSQRDHGGSVPNRCGNPVPADSGSWPE